MLSWVPDFRKGFEGNVCCGVRDLFILLGEVCAGGDRGVGIRRRRQPKFFQNLIKITKTSKNITFKAFF